MAKGAKRKTKWVSLSLANANTKPSNAAGSDSEQTSHSQQQNYGEETKTVVNSNASKRMGAACSTAKQHQPKPCQASGELQLFELECARGGLTSFVSVPVPYRV
uniref:Uncharacterized protein n=1 Tax=Anopheles culicifacies TaxID=139723 RepID=A0A182MID9_9DIPT